MESRRQSLQVSRGIAFATGDDELPRDLRTLDDGEEFEITTVPLIGDELGRPLPDATECIVVGHDPPKIDGLAVTAWLRDHYPSLPIVLYPSRSSEALAAAAVNVEVDAYVSAHDGGSTDLLRSQLRRLSERSVPVMGTDDVESERRGSLPTGRPEAMPMFDALLTSLPRWVSIYVKDRQGRHIAISGSEIAFNEDVVITTPDGKKLHSREDLLGKTDFDIYSAELAKETRPQEQRIMRTEEPMVNYLETVVDPLGDTIHNSTTKAPWYDENGNVAGIVGITVEITDRIERERALERQNERLDRFAGVLSHDIRNPLAVASGQVELLEEMNLPDEAEDSLDDLDWALERIEALIEDTLVLAREGATVSDPELVDLPAVARAAWRAAGDDRGRLSIDADLSSIAGAPDRVQRLLENLFANALDHGNASDDTEPLGVTVGPLADGFYVADDGVGIPENERGDVFGHGYSTREEGTGFGLAIVEEIAAAHDWSVVLTEAADGGARFEFRDVDAVPESNQ